MDLPVDVLLRPAGEAVRRIALALIEAASSAERRLGDADDAEALHDFRVALRRLRSHLRVWREPLRGVVRRKDRRRLGDLQDRTGAGRDAEVALAWVGAQLEGLAAEHRPGADWLGERLRSRQSAALAHVDARVRGRFRSLAGDLTARLAIWTVERDLREEAVDDRFGAALASSAREQGAALGELLGGLDASSPAARLHATRLAAKRLRYTVEPARPYAEPAREVVRCCRQLQDLLGDLNDCANLAELLDAAIAATATERADRVRELLRAGFPDRARREGWFTEWPGLLELAAALAAQRGELLAELESGWLGGREELSTALRDLDAALAPGAQSDEEIERKFLLRALPPLAGRVSESLEIEQGWLPGDRLRERVRVIREAGEARYLRCLKLGRGERRFELEEATSQEVFSGLWPLTRGCRLHKRRHRVPEGELVWEVDEFLDRELALAEVELPAVGHPLELPAWLEPLVVREVTGEAGFSGSELGR